MRAFCYAGGELPLGKKTYIMGILNITPDSFYDGGRYFDPEKAIKKAVELQNDGADILDIGAVSTRPGAERANEKEELKRLESVFIKIRKSVDIPISVDTFRPAVARYSLNNGADIINDVSGVFSTEMSEVIKKFSAGWIVMHSGENGSETGDVLDYPLGVVNHVQHFFDCMLEQSKRFGLKTGQLCLDPGFGFAKTAPQNIELLKNFDMLKTDGAALMCALSKKRFIRELFSEDAKEKGIDGTVAANIAAVLSGADIIRVHDVKEHKKIIAGIDKLAR